MDEYLQCTAVDFTGKQCPLPALGDFQLTAPAGVPILCLKHDKRYRKEPDHHSFSEVVHGHGSHPNSITGTSAQDVDTVTRDIPPYTAKARDKWMIMGYNLYSKVAVTEEPTMTTRVMGFLLDLDEDEILDL